MTQVAHPGDCTPEEARELIDGIRADLAGLTERITTAWERRAWVALGYDSWALMCQHEFGGALPKLPPGKRAPVVRDLSHAGMSQRAIGSALGVAKGTVQTDLASTGQNCPVERPGVVVGINGKRYSHAAQQRQPSPPVIEPEPEPETLQPYAAAYLDQTRRFADAAGRLAGAWAPTRRNLIAELRAVILILQEQDSTDDE